MRASAREPWCLFIPAVLSVLLTCSAVSPSLASKIEFRWPLPAKTSVSMSAIRDSTGVTLRWDTRVHATPHPNELRVRTENVEILQMGEGEFLSDAPNLTSQFEALMAKSPPITISRTGEYLRFSGMDEMMEGMLDLMERASHDAAVPESVWKRVEAVFRSPEMKAQMESSSEETWNLWVANWLDLELDPGQEFTGETPWTLGDVTFPVTISFRHLGPAALDPEIVWLEMETVCEGEAATRAMERHFRSLIQSMGGNALSAEPIFRSIRRVDHALVALEARTARPSYARSGQETEAVGHDGSRSVKTVSSDYSFEWSPPLGRSKRVDTVPDSVIAWFRAGRIEDAYQPLWTAAAEGSRHPDVHAYLGEIYRRSERPGDAVLAARRALSLAPRHAFAHNVLAEAFQPMYGSWYKANADSSWAHLLEGIACDSTDGNLWLSVYVEALRRGRSDLASRSLRSLHATKFFTPAALAYARWMVAGLPKGSLLVTNGDMDSYPLWCLQEIEGLRRDVAVVNVSLLNTPWYARYISDQFNVPIPVTDSLETAGRSRHMVDGWAAMRSAGSLVNPLFLSVTVSKENMTPDVAGRRRLVGASWQVCSDSSEAGLDTSAVRLSLESTRPEDFRGPVVSERDRSPVRAGSKLLSNVVESRLQYAMQLLEAGRRADAAREVQRAWDAAKRSGHERLSAASLEAAQSYLDAAPK